MIRAGRKIGSKVKLTPFSERLYPQWAGKVGKISRKEILTVGHGLAYGQRGRYVVAYWVRFPSERRDYLLSAFHLRKA